MKLGVLYSGGKDSTLALIKAKEQHKITCLITLISVNNESYMFHTPNIDITSLQAQAMHLPLVRVETAGEKEHELADLKKALALAQKKYNIEGVVTGAIRSTYQASRIQQACHELGIWCFNPLWLLDQEQLLHIVVASNITAIISGVFAEPLDESFLGKKLDLHLITQLCMLARKHSFNPAGEGGEIETTVLDAPVFHKKILIENTSNSYQNHAGTYTITAARLALK